MAAAWETLTFNFANQAAGTAALNLAYTYNKVSIFFNFGVTGAVAGQDLLLRRRGLCALSPPRRMPRYRPARRGGLNEPLGGGAEGHCDIGGVAQQ